MKNKVVRTFTGFLAAMMIAAQPLPVMTVHAQETSAETIEENGDVITEEEPAAVSEDGSAENEDVITEEEPAAVSEDASETAAAPVNPEEWDGVSSDAETVSPKEWDSVSDSDDVAAPEEWDSPVEADSVVSADSSQNAADQTEYVDAAKVAEEQKNSPRYSGDTETVQQPEEQEQSEEQEQPEEQADKADELCDRIDDTMNGVIDQTYEIPVGAQRWVRNKVADLFLSEETAASFKGAMDSFDDSVGTVGKTIAKVMANKVTGPVKSVVKIAGWLFG